jgi:hypothetical protein
LAAFHGERVRDCRGERLSADSKVGEAGRASKPPSGFARVMEEHLEERDTEKRGEAAASVSKRSRDHWTEHSSVEDDHGVRRRRQRVGIVRRRRIGAMPRAGGQPCRCRGVSDDNVGERTAA